MHPFCINDSSFHLSTALVFHLINHLVCHHLIPMAWLCLQGLGLGEGKFDFLCIVLRVIFLWDNETNLILCVYVCAQLQIKGLGCKIAFVTWARNLLHSNIAAEERGEKNTPATDLHFQGIKLSSLTSLPLPLVRNETLGYFVSGNSTQ